MANKTELKIKFNSELPYQKAAVEAALGVFSGAEKFESLFTISEGAIENLGNIGYGNKVVLTDNAFVKNIHKVQSENGIAPTPKEKINIQKLDFTIEMETGTGKTYVYLRTILEMYKRYGLTKFVIVVPSLPIREGVKKTLDITQSHFKAIFQNVQYRFFTYDSSKLSDIRQFAIDTSLQIMVINIQAFSERESKKNLMNKVSESLGCKPIDLVRQTRPLIIIDEPQTTVSTKTQIESVYNFNPMAIYRFSATHKEKTIELFRLNAVDAYNQKLVKQIEVGSAGITLNYSLPYFKLIEVKKHSDKKPTAILELDILNKQSGKIDRKNHEVKMGDNLGDITHREEYNIYEIDEITYTPDKPYILVSTIADKIYVNQTLHSADDHLLTRHMIAKTIEAHLEKEISLNPKGIKVLTLFFIDRVSNYRYYTEGESHKGIFAKIFEEEYARLIVKPKFNTLFLQLHQEGASYSEVHNGYFSIDKNNRFTDTDGSSKNDENTYNLIMRDKELLLSFDSKLRFIFSHSALKEGWDNPNVFQICSLKSEGGSMIRRRQEIGRGLRLCVNQHGERITDLGTNILTVIASEKFEDYAKNLQREIEEETGIKFEVLQKDSFSLIITGYDQDGEPMYFSESEAVYNYLRNQNLIDKNGKIQDTLKMAIDNDTLTIPDVDEAVLSEIKKTIAKVARKIEIKNREERKKVNLNQKIYDNPEFKALWDKIKYKTYYTVQFDTETLVQKSAEEIAKIRLVSGFSTFSKASINIDESGTSVGNIQNYAPEEITHEVSYIPDFITYTQSATLLTRKTVIEIFNRANNYKMLLRNPQKFTELSIEIIEMEKKKLIVDGIKYTRIGDDEYYNQELFKADEFNSYLSDRLRETTKSPFEFVEVDSQIESQFVEEFEKHENIITYIKLPKWFIIPTPLGTYNPDWAVLWRDDKEERLYFAVESKGTNNQYDLPFVQDAKIKCGKAHFFALDVHYFQAMDIDKVNQEAMLMQKGEAQVQ